MQKERLRHSGCQVTTDGCGDHHVSCGGNGDRIRHHDSLRDALFSAAVSVALVHRKEVPALIPETSSHPADSYLPHWKCGKLAALDMTVISPLQKLTIWDAATSQSHSLEVGEERNRSSHSPGGRDFQRLEW